MVGIHAIDVRVIGSSLFIDEIKKEGNRYIHLQFEKRGKNRFMRLKSRTLIK